MAAPHFRACVECRLLAQIGHAAMSDLSPSVEAIPDIGVWPCPPITTLLFRSTKRSLWMSRPRERVCLQDGLKLDLNRLARRGFIAPGGCTGPRGISWTHSYWGEVATGLIRADISGRYEGWLRIQLGKLDQWITLIPQDRHFGGRQWYFRCPVKDHLVSVLWKPNGAPNFAVGRHGGGRLPTNRNSTTRPIERTLGKPG